MLNRVILFISKWHIFYFLLLATLSAFNIYAYIRQISETNYLCDFNDVLPFRVDYRHFAMPVVVYRRFLEFSVTLSCLQLLTSLIAFGCNIPTRQRGVVYMCHSFIFIFYFLGIVLFIGIVYLSFTTYVYRSVKILLNNVFYDETFCGQIQPKLLCKYVVENSTNVVIEYCSHHENTIRIYGDEQQDCLTWLTKAVYTRSWIIYPAVGYAIIVFISLSQFVSILIQCNQQSKTYGQLSRTLMTTPNASPMIL